MTSRTWVSTQDPWGNTLRDYIDADGGNLISQAQNATAIGTSITATPAAVPGAIIRVPARTRPFVVRFQGMLTNTGQAAGAYGILYLSLYEVTGGTATLQEELTAWVPSGVTSGFFLDSKCGEVTYDRATTDRMFSVYGHTFNEGTGTLTGSISNGNGGTGITSIKAVGL